MKILSLLCLALILFSSCTKNSNVNVKSNETKESAPFYEIVNDRSSGNGIIYDVFVKDADHVIRVNDLLVNKIGTKDVVVINYFVDRSIAKDYFSKQLDNSSSEQEKAKMFSYYVAVMKVNSTGTRALFQNDKGGWKEMKKY